MAKLVEVVASLYALAPGEFLQRARRRRLGTRSELGKHFRPSDSPQKLALHLEQQRVEVGLHRLAHELARDAIVTAGDERGGRLEVQILAVKAHLHAVLEQRRRVALSADRAILDQMPVARGAAALE